MLSDKHFDFSATMLVAWLLWAGVTACMVIMFVLAFAAEEVLAGLVFGTLGCALSAAAAVAQIRGFMCVFSHRMKAAFELGRSVEREQQEARELRSV